ncbi:MAG: hypothetical protein ACLU4P_09480 [Ruminococcus sp.]
MVSKGHKITDVDALGAAIGIYRAGKTLGKPVHIVVNDPTTSIRPLMAGYINNPDYEPSMFVDCAQAKDLVDQIIQLLWFPWWTQTNQAIQSAPGSSLSGPKN